MKRATSRTEQAAGLLDPHGETAKLEIVRPDVAPAAAASSKSGRAEAGPALQRTDAMAPWPDAWRYPLDAWQRSVLFLDTLRRRANDMLEHERAGLPPLLDFKYETILDARRFERPANYALLRITEIGHDCWDDCVKPDRPPLSAASGARGKLWHRMPRVFPPATNARTIPPATGR